MFPHYQKWKDIINIQTDLCELKIDNYESLEKLMITKLSSDQIARFLLTTFQYKPHQIGSLFIFIGYLKKYPIFPEIAQLLIQKGSPHFLCYGMLSNLWTFEEILPRVSNFSVRSAISLFGPELEEKSPDVFNKFLKKSSLVPNLSSLRENNWQLLREYREVKANPSDIATIIRNDDINSPIFSDPKFDPNMLIPDSLYEPCDFLKEGKPPLICYAAFFGSSQIYSLLKKLGADPYQRDFNDYDSIHYAVGGCNYNLIRQIPLPPSYFSLGSFGALFQSNLNMKWLINTKKSSYDRELGFEGNVLHMAAISNNVEAAVLAIHNGVDVNSQNLKSEVPLFIAAKNNSIEVAQVLIETGECDTKFTDDDLLEPAEMAQQLGFSILAKIIDEAPPPTILTEEEENDIMNEEEENGIMNEEEENDIMNEEEEN